MKQALVLYHAANVGLASFRAPIEQAGYAIRPIEMWRVDVAAVDLLAPDLVVVLGGPMGAYSIEAHPWIVAEIDLIAARLAADRPTLGICLGAQMMAAALGAAVYPGPVPEIGFVTLDLTEAGRGSPLRHVAATPILEWHGDTFDLPADVESLAATSAYTRQAFRRGDRILALQFHAEMGEDPRVEEWIAYGGAYLGRAGTDVPALRDDHQRHGPAAVAAGRHMIADWLARL